MTILNGIGYSEQGNIFMAEGYGGDGAVAATAKPKEEYVSGDWSPWGADNAMPKEMAEHIENCGVLNAGLDAKARIAAGKGLEPFFRLNIDADGNEELEYCKDAEVNDWIEANKFIDLQLDFAYDKNSYGWRTGSFMLNGARNKINRILRKDVYECRLGKKNNRGKIETLYMSADWAAMFGKFDKSKGSSLPVLDSDNELEDLQKRTHGHEFAFVNRRRRDGRQYYPLPLWYSAREWVKQARAIPIVKNSLIDNAMHIKYVVTIHKQYWIDHVNKGFETLPETERQGLMAEVFTAINTYLVGGSKAGKTFFTGSFYDHATQSAVSYVSIVPLDDKQKDGKLIVDSSAANSEILFALQVNPALSGAGQPGGAYSNNAGGSNIREAHLSQIMLLEEERAMNAGPMYVVKKFNGWADRLETEGKRLVFRTPSGLLTTLDTGKSTKPEIV